MVATRRNRAPSPRTGRRAHTQPLAAVLLLAAFALSGPRAEGQGPPPKKDGAAPPASARAGAVVYLTGTVNRDKLEALERQVQKGVARGSEVIILYLDCAGGDTKDVAAFAKKLRRPKDNSGREVQTIAYVPPGRALGAATFLALGCSRIIMGKGSALGDFEYLEGSAEAVSARAQLAAELAQHQRERKEKDLEPQGQPDKALPLAQGQLLRIDTKLARTWGLAHSTDVNNLDDLYRSAGVDPRTVWVAQDDRLGDVAEFFRQDLVQFLLIVLGIAGLILELKMPGTAVPGIVAAVCFVLFFWANSFHGHFTTPALFLFVLGVILIGLEIFVLPGFAVAGVSGVALVVVSLVLATLEKMPSTSAEWVDVGATAARLGLGLLAAIVGASVLAWYLPHIPYANRLVLTPPDEGANGAGGDAFGGRHEEAAALLGAIGVAATTLRPSGKARFGEDYLDVIAEGDYVNPGSRVQVIEIEGNRIVVKEV